MMKTLFIGLLLAVSLNQTAQAQFRSDAEKDEQKQLDTRGAMSSPTSEDNTSFFSSLFDPTRFSMHQTYSMSYSSMAGVGGIGISMFTNTFSYRATENLIISADVSAVYSPFNSFSNQAVGSQIQKDINGVYLSNARLDWKLGEHSFLSIQYSGLPGNGMFPGYNGYSNPFYGYQNPFSSQSQNPFGVHTTSASLVH